MTESISTRLPGSLVSTDWLAAHLDEPSIRVVDIRGYVRSTDLGGGKQKAVYEGAPDEYAAGHIPGAVFVDWTTDITDPDNPVKVQIAPPDRFAAAMEARGIGDETDVVVIDHAGGHFATRLWWALRYYGHDRVAVLDGGYKRWLAENRPMTSEVAAPPKSGKFTPRTRPGLRVEPEEILAAIAAGNRQIVDAREPGQYDGSIVRASRGGHIPTAVNVPLARFMTGEGTWKSPEAVRKELRDSGVADDGSVIAYCNGGVTATGLLFALDRAGYAPGANYDGSWNEWGERPDLPTETGPDSRG